MRTAAEESGPQDCKFSSTNSGGGDVAAKMEMVIYDPSFADPAKTNWIGKVTPTFSKRLFQIC